MTNAKAKRQLNRLINSIQQTEVKELERQRQQLAAYVDNCEADIEEAAAYFRIGENKLRRIIAENPDADFVLWNGTRGRSNAGNLRNTLIN